MYRSSSRLNVPAMNAPSANMPYGASSTTKFVTFERALAMMPSSSSNGFLSGTEMSAAPRMMLNSTTAGTTLFASELNGFDGM